MRLSPLALRLVAYRQEHGLTLQQVRQALALRTTETLMQWEAGRPIPIDKIFDIAEYLGLDLGEAFIEEIRFQYPDLLKRKEVLQQLSTRLSKEIRSLQPSEIH